MYATIALVVTLYDNFGQHSIILLRKFLQFLVTLLKEEIRAGELAEGGKDGKMVESHWCTGSVSSLGVANHSPSLQQQTDMFTNTALGLLSWEHNMLLLTRLNTSTKSGQLSHSHQQGHS